MKKTYELGTGADNQFNASLITQILGNSRGCREAKKVRLKSLLLQKKLTCEQNSYLTHTKSDQKTPFSYIISTLSPAILLTGISAYDEPNLNYDFCSHVNFSASLFLAS